MGLGLFIGKKIVKKAALYATYKGVNKLEQNHSVNDNIKKSTIKNKYFAKRKSKFSRSKFIVYDKNKEKYLILYENNWIYLNDKNNNSIGKIKYSSIDHIMEYDLYLNNKKIDHLVFKPSIRNKYEIPSKKWKTSSKGLNYNFDIYDENNNIVIKINRDFHLNEYSIEYYYEEDEIYALFLFMIFEQMYQTNK